MEGQREQVVLLHWTGQIAYSISNPEEVSLFTAESIFDLHLKWAAQTTNSTGGITVHDLLVSLLTMNIIIIEK